MDKTGTLIPENPSIAIVKGSSINLGADNIATIGDIITYSYDVTNTGNVPLHNVNVTESTATFTGTGTLPTPTFVSANQGSLAGLLKVGEKATYSATYAITMMDILAGKIDNQAYADGLSPKNVAVKDTSDSKNNADYNETGSSSSTKERDRTGTILVPETDVAISKFVNNSMPSLGDTVTYTIIAKNIGLFPATNVKVVDSLNVGLGFVSATTTNGTWTSPTWDIPLIAPGDSAILTIKAFAKIEGVINNIAKLDTMDQLDSDPSNNQDKSCISVPVALCQGKTLELSAPVGYTNVIWFKNGTQVGTGNTFIVNSTGDYTMTADQGGPCGTGSCCPLRIQTEVCCEPVCVPISAKKIR